MRRQLRDLEAAIINQARTRSQQAKKGQIDEITEAYKRKLGVTGEGEMTNENAYKVAADTLGIDVEDLKARVQADGAENIARDVAERTQNPRNFNFGTRYKGVEADINDQIAQNIWMRRAIGPAAAVSGAGAAGVAVMNWVDPERGMSISTGMNPEIQTITALNEFLNDSTPIKRETQALPGVGTPVQATAKQNLSWHQKPYSERNAIEKAQTMARNLVLGLNPVVAATVATTTDIWDKDRYS